MSASQNLKVTWKNVPTRTITAGGVEFAYRELGTNNPGTPASGGIGMPAHFSRVLQWKSPCAVTR